MIRKNTAIKTCQSWHGGQWSALYQYASSGIYVPENALRYCWEVLQELQNEFFAPYPRKLLKREQRELDALLIFFVQTAKKNGIGIHMMKHTHYNYYIPVIHTNRDNVKIISITIPK